VHYLIFITVVILVCGLLSPFLLEKITDAWMWIGEKIGAVMSRIILSFLYVLFLTPIAITYRLFSGRKAITKKESYFIERNHTYTAADMDKIF